MENGIDIVLDLSLPIKLRLIHPECMPLQDNKGSWIDLRSRVDVSIRAGQYVEIPLGVAMQLPTGMEAVVVPRSSTFKRWGLLQTNSMGVIDPLYCGNDDEWHFPAYATRDCEIHQGDRLCQFRVQVEQPEIYFAMAEKLYNQNRGGLGSTGVK